MRTVFNICADCGYQSNDLHHISDFAGLKPCVVPGGIVGTTRKTVEPYFENERDVCYPCYVAEVKADKRAGRNIGG